MADQFVPICFCGTTFFFLFRFYSILCTAISALVGWPFAAILGLPVALQMLVVSPKRLASKFLSYALAAGGPVAIALIVVDTSFYGLWVLVSLRFCNFYSDWLMIYDLLKKLMTSDRFFFFFY